MSKSSPSGPAPRVSGFGGKATPTAFQTASEMLAEEDAPPPVTALKENEAPVAEKADDGTLVLSPQHSQTGTQSQTLIERPPAEGHTPPPGGTQIEARPPVAAEDTAPAEGAPAEGAPAEGAAAEGAGVLVFLGYGAARDVGVTNQSVSTYVRVRHTPADGGAAQAHLVWLPHVALPSLPPDVRRPPT